MELQRPEPLTQCQLVGVNWFVCSPVRIPPVKTTLDIVKHPCGKTHTEAGQHASLDFSIPK